MTSSYDNTAAQETALALRERIGSIVPRIAIVLGSGLGGVVEDVTEATHVPYRDVPGFTDIHVEGQSGTFVTGMMEHVPVVVLAGRFHLYEGHSPALSAFPVRVARALGARKLFVSHAAGGINRQFAPGDLMSIEDHLNLMGRSPLVGPVDRGDVRFPDMSAPYDAELRALLAQAAARLGVTLRSGVFAGVLGPSYETRAEIRMLATMGADAVCMSTVPEVIVARALGMRVVGVSCITNMASGIQETPLDHAEVLLTTARIADRFRALVKTFVTSLPK